MSQAPIASGTNGRHASSSKHTSSSSRKGEDGVATSSKAKTSVPLTQELLNSFAPSKVFAEPRFTEEHTVTSLAFDDRGEHLVTAGSDDVIHIFSCSRGQHAKTLYSKKYGVQLARFTHRNDSVIYASTKEDDTIRHHSLPQNKYLQYFRGHHSKVTTLQMSPVNDTFLSAAQDESLRLWDLRSSECQGQFPLQGRPIVAWDPAGDVFALGIGEEGIVMLYDVKSMSPQPLLTTRLQERLLVSSGPPPFVTSLAFHPGGKMLLVGTTAEALYILDAYEPRILFALNGHECFKKDDDDGAPDIDACGQDTGWTPDGQFVFASSQSKGIQTWRIPDLKDLDKETVYPLSLLPTRPPLPQHPGKPARAVAFNPRFAMLATASTRVALWLPPAPEEET